MQIVFDRISGPAETDCKRIYINPWWWFFRLNAGERKFIRLHEEAHCQGAFDSELQADEMALESHLETGGRVADAISSLQKLPPSPLNDQRIEQMQGFRPRYKFTIDPPQEPETEGSGGGFMDILELLLGSAPDIIDSWKQRGGGYDYPPEYYQRQQQGIGGTTIAIIAGVILIIFLIVFALKK